MGNWIEGIPLKGFVGLLFAPRGEDYTRIENMFVAKGSGMRIEYFDRTKTS